MQSGGETSLDSATIIFRIHDDFRVLYSSALFDPGGLIGLRAVVTDGAAVVHRNYPQIQVRTARKKNASRWSLCLGSQFKWNL